ncbi:DUF1826 domain-containing protein [Balneatrix alpica]|uniref:DUF1826 domain-containing protein n=1 Tax=Balneatrix alpica TaxID=75684 RepID=UPI002738ED03|nr:DUF1826 domain-containing protein [Balneatrix alpica]
MRVADARALSPLPALSQSLSPELSVCTDILKDEVNLVLWQRRLTPEVADFAARLAEDGDGHWLLTLAVREEDEQVELADWLSHASHWPGYQAFIDDVAELCSLYACLLGAKTLGLRLRSLDHAQCPRWHVDQVSVRLVCAYHGPGPQWVPARQARTLSAPNQQPVEVRQAGCGEVAWLKGERWMTQAGADYQGQGIVHRSPPLAQGQRRVLLTLDWLE